MGINLVEAAYGIDLNKLLNKPVVKEDKKPVEKKPVLKETLLTEAIQEITLATAKQVKELAKGIKVPIPVETKKQTSTTTTTKSNKADYLNVASKTGTDTAQSSTSNNSTGQRKRRGKISGGISATTDVNALGSTNTGKKGSTMSLTPDDVLSEPGEEETEKAQSIESDEESEVIAELPQVVVPELKNSVSTSIRIVSGLEGISPKLKNIVSQNLESELNDILDKIKERADIQLQKKELADREKRLNKEIDVSLENIGNKFKELGVEKLTVVTEGYTELQGKLLDIGFITEGNFKSIRVGGKELTNAFKLKLVQLSKELTSNTINSILDKIESEGVNSLRADLTAIGTRATGIASTLDKYDKLSPDQKEQKITKIADSVLKLMESINLLLGKVYRTNEEIIRLHEEVYQNIENSKKLSTKEILSISGITGNDTSTQIEDQISEATNDIKVSLVVNQRDAAKFKKLKTSIDKFNAFLNKL